ncbi:diguanylate cyclase domain-containing protein [Quadrisphaera sp. KR29]|uniref:diguanylate cyclase domain-containing protein n=1 Tax=Quadrisphaera sp. KR29 TaxID=3461391 RepID=UPI004044F5B3
MTPPGPRALARALPLAGVAGSAAAVAAVCLLARWAVVEGAGLHVPVLAAAASGALLGAMAAPAVRLPLERRDAEGRGALIVLVGMVLAGSVVTVLGFAPLAAATSAGCAAHAVQVRPTRRQLWSTCAMVVATSAAAWGAHAAGWVDGLVTPSRSAVLMVAMLAIMCPQVLNAASISRRAQEAASALERVRSSHVAQLEHAAAHDALTGLLSRRGLAPRLERAAAAARPGALTGVVFIDLDGFKAVNDAHGHAAGDALLQEVAARLLRVLRPTDAAARTGGDEFVVVMEDLARAGQVDLVVERVRAELERPVLLPDGSRVVVGASTGVAVADAPQPAEALLAGADAAMYATKQHRSARAAGAAARTWSPAHR